MSTENTKLLISNLHSHPHQQAFFAECSKADDAALAADLKLRGQLAPIVVMPVGNAAGLPGGTILDGHRRAQLMASNGQTQVNVLVRDDLMHATAAMVEAEFLRFNYQRRQLHPLDKARIAKRLYEIERNRAPGSLLNFERREARERVGRAIGMSGRNLDRYFAVLETPLEVQNAVKGGRLKLVIGARLAQLPKPTQIALAKSIEQATDKAAVKQIVADCLELPEDHRHQKTADAFASLVRALERGLHDLEDRVAKVSPKRAGESLGTLQRASQLIQRVIKAAHTRG